VTNIIKYFDSSSRQPDQPTTVKGAHNHASNSVYIGVHWSMCSMT